MTTTPGFSSIPPEPNDGSSVWRNWAHQIGSVIGTLRQGKLDCTGTFTLTINVATSTFTDPRLAQQSVVVWDATTANAAVEMAAGTMYVLLANRNRATWTVTHANNAQADRTFRYAIIG